MRRGREENTNGNIPDGRMPIRMEFPRLAVSVTRSMGPSVGCYVGAWSVRDFVAICTYLNYVYRKKQKNFRD